MTESRTKKHIAAWISRVMLTLGEGKALLKLRIQDPGDYGRKDLLREYILDPARPADQLALEIEHDAEQEAEGTGHGVHHFQLHAFRDGENKHFNATSFLLASQEAPEDDRPEADGRTLLAQTQRHLEAMAKISAQERASMVQGFHQITHGLTEQLAQYQAMQLQILQLAQSNTIDRAKLDFDIETRKALLELAKGVAAIAGPVVIPRMIEKWMTPPVEEQPVSAIPEQTVAAALPAIIAEAHQDATEPSRAPMNGHANGQSKKRKGS